MIIIYIFNNLKRIHSSLSFLCVLCHDKANHPLTALKSKSLTHDKSKSLTHDKSTSLTHDKSTSLTHDKSTSTQTFHR